MKEMNILLAAGVALITSCGVAAEKLGDGFAPLDWIESTGGQYIDTGVDAGAHTTIDMSFGHCVYGNGSTLFEMSVAGRPIICTEWLFRPSGCDVPNILCIYKETGIGCMLWGLVNGKAQTHLPNGGFTANYKGPWKHDLFHSDHRPYSVTDLELIKKATGGASAGTAAKK